MSKKAFKRQDSVEETIEEATVLSSLPQMVIGTARKTLSLLTAHRWKFLGAATVAAATLTIVTGAVDVAGIASSVTQYATARTGGAEGAQTVSESEARSAVDVVAAGPSLKHAKPAQAVMAAVPTVPAAPSIAPSRITSSRWMPWPTNSESMPAAAAPAMSVRTASPIARMRFLST